MNLNFTGEYKSGKSDVANFSFDTVVSEEECFAIMQHIDPDGGYPHYDKVKNYVVAHLKEIGVLPPNFNSGVYGFASELAKHNIERLNFDVTDGSLEIRFNCINNS